MALDFISERESEKQTSLDKARAQFYGLMQSEENAVTSHSAGVVAAKKRANQNQQIQQNAEKLDQDDGRLIFTLPWLEKKVKEHEKFIFQLEDLQNEVNDLMVDNEHLKVQVDEAQRIAVGASSNRLIGAGMVSVNGDQVGWRYDKESHGWFKVDGDKLWMYSGYIRNADTYHFVDSQVLTLSDTATHVYVSQSRSSLTTGIAQMVAMPDDTTSEYRWPILRLVRKDPGGGGDYTWETTNVYHTGDIPKKRFVCDANSPYGGRLKSLQKRGSADTHYDDGEIYEWHNPTTIAVDHADLMIVQDVGQADKPVRYFTTRVMSNFVENNLAASPGGLGQTYAYYYNTNHSIIHHQLNSTTGKASGDFDDGGGEENEDHDKRYWASYDIASSIDAKGFRTTGAVWESELHLSADGSTDSQYWTAAAQKVNVTGAIDIDAGSGIAIDAVNDITITAASLGITLTGTAFSGVASNGAASLTGSDNVVLTSVSEEIALLANTDIELIPTSDLKINGLIGWSGTVQVTQNGVTKDATITKGIITNVA